MSERPQRKHRELKATLSVSGMPEVIAHLRREMARVLRDEAQGEPAIVRAFAERVAAIFETGLGEDLPDK